MSFTYKYPRPAVTVDAIIFRNNGNKYEVLLIQRGQYPFEGMWAFPGGFVDMDETLEDAAIRELEEETNLKNIPLNQFHTFSKVDRDPRGRTIATAFWGILNYNQEARAGDDASKVSWFSLDKLPPLAFDHSDMMKMAFESLPFLNLTD